MDDQNKTGEVTLKLRRAAKGGYTLDVDGDFAAARSSIGETLMLIGETLCERYGEAPKPDAPQADRANLLEELVDHIRSRAAPQVPMATRFPASGSGGKLPPDLNYAGINSGFDPSQQHPHHAARFDPASNNHDPDMPQIIRAQQPDGEIEELAGRIRTQQNGNGHRSNGIAAFVVIAAASALLRYAQMSGLT